VMNSLIDMYAKCGSMEDAWRVFNKMPSCNVVSWNIMLGGYAMQEHGIEALALFERMCEEGVEMSNITFVYLLSACSHAGLVDEGLCYFESMSMVYKIPATVEHYTCMVDLLGHASYLHEAEDMVKTVPSKADVAVLRALLGACRLQPNLEIGE
jgi:pentatricopeptide repeat protein